MGNEESEKPLLADGSLVEDYRLLLEYWKLARRKDKRLAEEATLSNEDFKEIEDIVRSVRHIAITDLISFFKDEMKKRLDPDLAVEAATRIYGIEVDKEKALEELAEILALWLLEASRILGIIKYHSWRDHLEK